MEQCTNVHCLLGDIMTTVDTAVKIDEKIEKQVKEPSRYKVIFVNDDVTPVDWVIELLQVVFKHDYDSSEQITMQIHNEGSGIAGVYSYEIAEQKVVEATSMSRSNGFPLIIEIEAE